MLVYLSYYIERDRFADEDDKRAWKGAQVTAGAIERV